MGSDGSLSMRQMVARLLAAVWSPVVEKKLQTAPAHGIVASLRLVSVVRVESLPKKNAPCFAMLIRHLSA